MRLIAIETSSARGSVALWRDAAVLEHVAFPEGLAHGRELAVHVAGLVRRHGLVPAGIDGFVVSIGPGSYTGIRVGVAAAKTMAFALGRPLAPVSSLQVIAGNAFGFGAGEGPAHARSGGGQPILVALDGKQGYLYRGLYRGDGDTLETLVPDGVQRWGSLREDAAPAAWRDAVILGDGADQASQLLVAAGFDVRRGPAHWDWPRADVLATLGHGTFARGGQGVREGAAIHGVQPVYLRPSEAERRLAARERLPGAPAAGGARP